MKKIILSALLVSISSFSALAANNSLTCKIRQVSDNASRYLPMGGVIEIKDQGTGKDVAVINKDGKNLLTANLKLSKTNGDTTYYSIAGLQLRMIQDSDGLQAHLLINNPLLEESLYLQSDCR